METADGKLLHRYDFHDEDFAEGKDFAILPNVNNQRRPFLLNGNRVLNPTELRFGAKLSFGDQSHTFLFKERYEPIIQPVSDAPRKRNDTDQKLGSTPVQNGLIVSYILSHLPTQEIKNFRFLSKLWNEEAMKILKKRCFAVFDLKCGYNRPEESMKLFRYSVEMKDFPLQNWWINIPPIQPPRFDDDNGMNLKLMDDLSWFISKTNKPHHVKKLVIGGNLESSRDLKIRLDILDALKENITELELSGMWHHWSNEGGIILNINYLNIHFPKLQTFTLSIIQNPDLDPPTFVWFYGLMLAISGVSSIQLRCDSEISETFLECLGIILPSTFPNLNKICLPDVDIFPRIIQYLLNLDKPLKTLELGILEMPTKEYFEFYKLLEKHASTLESLQFIVSREQDSEPVRINMPTFPNLRRLNVSWRTVSRFGI